MSHKNLLTPLLALLLAGSTTTLLAQDAPPPASAADAPGPHQGGPGGPGHEHGPGPGPGPGPAFGGRPPEPEGGVIGDLRELEHLYLEAGRAKDLPALYNEVLAKSQNPRVRDYAYHQLARMQSRPSNVDQAIATLRKGLEENLTNDAKRESEHARMQARFDQPPAGTPPSPSSH